MNIERGAIIEVGNEEYHVTRIGAAGVYGHESRYCDKTECAGPDRYIPNEELETETREDGSRKGGPQYFPCYGEISKATASTGHTIVADPGAMRIRLIGPLDTMQYVPDDEIEHVAASVGCVVDWKRGAIREDTYALKKAGQS